MIYTKLFWDDATERMIATAAQVILSIVTVFLPAVAITNQRDLETAVQLTMTTFPLILLAGLGGALYALLKAVVAAYRAKTDTASLTVDNKPLIKEKK